MGEVVVCQKGRETNNYCISMAGMHGDTRSTEHSSSGRYYHWWIVTGMQSDTRMGEFDPRYEYINIDPFKIELLADDWIILK